MEIINIPYDLNKDKLNLKKMSSAKLLSQILLGDLSIMFDNYILNPQSYYTNIGNEYNDAIFTKYHLNKHKICKKLYNLIGNDLDKERSGVWPYSNYSIEFIDWIKIYNYLYFFTHKIDNSNLKKLKLL